MLILILVSANTLKILAITVTTAASRSSIDPFSAKQTSELAKQIRCISGNDRLTTKRQTDRVIAYTTPAENCTVKTGKTIA